MLIEGKATLYSYRNGNLKRYFYSKDTSNVKQLIFKNYLFQKTNQVAKNERYKQQLWKDLKCNNISIKEINTIDYKKSSLANFFIKFNQCSNSNFTKLGQKKRDFFHLTIRPGLLSSSLSTNHITSKYRNINFDNKLGLRLGLEAEFIFPFNKNKWAMIIEPTYQSYKTAKDITLLNSTTIVNVDYQSIELPIGLRYYSFLNNGSKLFFNSSIVLDFPLSSFISSERKGFIDLDIESTVNLTFGIGYNLKNKYNIELRYGLGREILNNYTSWSSDYKSLSLIFGYTLF